MQTKTTHPFERNKGQVFSNTLHSYRIHGKWFFGKGKIRKAIIILISRDLQCPTLSHNCHQSLLSFPLGFILQSGNSTLSFFFSEGQKGLWSLWSQGSCILAGWWQFTASAAFLLQLVRDPSRSYSTYQKLVYLSDQTKNKYLLLALISNSAFTLGIKPFALYGLNHQ